MFNDVFMEPFSPVEKLDKIWFKREDKFLPFGPGSMNGSKARQAIYLTKRYMASVAKPIGVVTGANMRSAQLPMAAALAKEMGVPCVAVIGSTKPDTAARYDMVALAHHYGAQFVISKVGYNPAIQAKVRELLEGPMRGWMQLEYGSSLDHKTHTAQEIEQFHRVTAKQVGNIPRGIKKLIVPTGSCNTLTSVMYGLAMHNTDVEEVICLQIGPDRQRWTYERLAMIEEASGHKIETPRRYIDLTLHWKYEDDQFAEYHGIQFHPTYEGKCWYWLENEAPQLINEDTCFWLTGDKPDYRKVAGYRKPERITLYGDDIRQVVAPQ